MCLFCFFVCFLFYCSVSVKLNYLNLFSGTHCSLCVCVWVLSYLILLPFLTFVTSWPHLRCVLKHFYYWSNSSPFSSSWNEWNFPPFWSHQQNNWTSSPDLLGYWFNNLAILLHDWRHFSHIAKFVCNVQLFNEVFVISGIIKLEVSVISRAKGRGW